jgi:hypothetical protein
MEETSRLQGHSDEEKDEGKSSGRGWIYPPPERLEILRNRQGDSGIFDLMVGSAARKAKIAALKADGQVPTRCRSCRRPLEEGNYVEMLVDDRLVRECGACNQALGG